jgi:nucleoside-diphosphate-sugar epimerase
MAAPLLVTGAKGLIGTALIQALKARGYTIQELDKALPIGEAGSFDIREIEQFASLTQRCSGIVHLAAVSRAVWGHRFPRLCWETNVNATRKLLTLVARSPLKPWVC